MSLGQGQRMREQVADEECSLPSCDAGAHALEDLPPSNHHLPQPGCQCVSGVLREGYHHAPRAGYAACVAHPGSSLSCACAMLIWARGDVRGSCKVQSHTCYAAAPAHTRVSVSTQSHTP